MISPESQIVVCLSCTIPKEVTQKETATVGLEKAIKELTPNPSCDSQVHVFRGGVNRFVGFSAGAIMLNLVESVPSQSLKQSHSDCIQRRLKIATLKMKLHQILEKSQQSTMNVASLEMNRNSICLRVL